jgi:hypothetical protein
VAPAPEPSAPQPVAAPSSAEEPRIELVPDPPAEAEKPRIEIVSPIDLVMGDDEDDAKYEGPPPPQPA